MKTSIVLFGVANLLLGLMGFVGPLNPPPDGIVADSFITEGPGLLFGVLATNWAHSLIHIGFGLYGLLAVRGRAVVETYGWAVAAAFALLLALGLLGVAGPLAIREPDGTLLTLSVAVNGVGHGVHAVWALIGVGIALAARRQHSEPMQQMMQGGVVLSVLVGGVLALGLLTVFAENVQVAPWARETAMGRQHFQTKNVTRLSGSEAAVREAVVRALSYQEGSAPPTEGDWQAAVQAATGWQTDPRHVVILPSEGEEASEWSLPGAYWAAFAGSPTLFVGRTEIESAQRQQLARLRLPVFVLAPPELIDENVVGAIREVAPVTRVAGTTLAEQAVRIASYRDEEAAFGWGRELDSTDLATWYHFFMTTPADARLAYVALPLARTVGGAFLFANENGGVPAATDRYWWSLRADWFVSPSETSFRHLWILGDRVSYAAQGRMDLAVEKSAYLTKGSVALGPLEGLGLVFMSLGLAGFLFVLLHAQRLLPELSTTMRAAWAFTALVVPVLGPILYVAAHRRPRLDTPHDMPAWLRPPALQAGSATAMGFGFGAPLMIAIGWLFSYYGFPLFFGEWAQGWQFVLGAGMPLMMAGMYVGAVLLAWPFVQTGMQAMMQGASPRSVRWRALGVTSLSMALVSLGMMTTGWFMMMERQPMMMPHEDEIIWFASLWLASGVGFLVAWPLNWPLVRVRLKSGAM